MPSRLPDIKLIRKETRSRRRTVLCSPFVKQEQILR
jgi:hypothetical protein